MKANVLVHQLLFGYNPAYTGGMMKRSLVAMFMFFALLNLSTQANFIQCSPDCIGTPLADLINGSDVTNTMQADAGNDLMFGGGGVDEMYGDQGMDLIFGGNDWDAMIAGDGNDTILPGPDGPNGIQVSFGGFNNDTFIVLAGETSNCQEIHGDQDFDELHLIGFGPYVAEHPYGQPGIIPIKWALVIQDPVAGGYILVFFSNLERINGLPSPNVTVLDSTEVETFKDQNCTRQ